MNTVRSALAVVAHPDDESFGLGAVLAQLIAGGTAVRVLCLTHGEASTLGATADLGAVREGELLCASEQLALTGVTMLSFDDGGLASVAPDVLDATVEARLGDADLLVVFEPGGVTGHPDHKAATAAAERVAHRRSLPVLEWGIAPDVAATLNTELGTAFVGISGDDIVIDRSTQMRAIGCHGSQVRDNPVLARRLVLQGDRERIRLRVADRDEQE